MKAHVLVPVLLFGLFGPLTAQTDYTPLSSEDVSGVQAAWQEWCDAALAGDLNRFAQSYSEQAVEIFESGQSNISRANVVVRVRSWFVNGEFTACANDLQFVEGSGNTAFAMASNTQSWINSQTQRTTDYAFNLWGMLKKESDGVWRFQLIHWVSPS